MATRGIRNFIAKAVFGKEIEAMRTEHNALVDEVEELKTAYKVHTHSALATKGPDGAAGTGFTPPFVAVEARKVT